MKLGNLKGTLFFQAIIFLMIVFETISLDQEIIDSTENRGLMLYLDNSVDKLNDQVFFYATFHAGIHHITDEKYISQDFIRLIPDISFDKIVIGYKPLSGWGLQYEKYLNEKFPSGQLNENFFTYNEQQYKCVESKLYINPLEGNQRKHEIKMLEFPKQLDVCIIIDELWPYQKEEFGIQGLSPSSPYYSYYNKISSTHYNGSLVSLHYQKEDLTTDDYKRLRTGDYIREFASTMVFNGKHGNQNNLAITSPVKNASRWVWDDVELHFNGLNMKKYSSNEKKEQLCFVNMYEELLFVDNPEVLTNNIIKEICEFIENNCKVSTANLLKMTPITLKIGFDKSSLEPYIPFTFTGDQVVTFDTTNNGKAKVLIGDLNELKRKKQCPESSTIAAGKRLMRFLELQMFVSSENNENVSRMMLGLYQYPKISTGVWVLLGIGITLSVILIVLTSYCMIKSCLRRGKKHVSYYYIEVDEPVD